MMDPGMSEKRLYGNDFLNSSTSFSGSVSASLLLRILLKFLVGISIPSASTASTTASVWGFLVMKSAPFRQMTGAPSMMIFPKITSAQSMMQYVANEKNPYCKISLTGLPSCFLQNGLLLDFCLAMLGKFFQDALRNII